MDIDRARKIRRHDIIEPVIVGNPGAADRPGSASGDIYFRSTWPIPRSNSKQRRQKIVEIPRPPPVPKMQGTESRRGLFLSPSGSKTAAYKHQKPSGRR